MTKFSPIDYIKIDIANMWGLDKKSFKERIAWVDSVKDLRMKIHTADKPAQFIAAVYALEDALAGEPTGHLVGLDACASGIAILGILMGCHTTSKNVGVIGSKRMDFYKECTDAMNKLLTDDVSVSRADAKLATMTSYYGSKAKPKEIFGEGTDELAAFYAAQDTIAPGAVFMMQELLDSWQPYELEHSHTLPDGYNAIVPVLQKIKSKIEIDELDHATLTFIYEDNVGSEKGLAVAANMTHAVDGFIVRETVRRCNYNRNYLTDKMIELDIFKDMPQSKPTHVMERLAKMHGFVSLAGADFINQESIKEFSMTYRSKLYELLVKVLAKPRFEVLTIHDEFKCHPNHMNSLREVYVNILAELADSLVGQQIIREVRNDPSYVLNKLSTDLGDAILLSEYFLS